MANPFKRTLLLPLAGLMVASTAHAVAIDFGTSELITFRDCIAGASGCDNVVSPPVLQMYGGSPGAAASSASNTVPGYGSASGSVSLSGTIGAPILRASASSDPGKRTNTNSVALQRYTYTGTADTTRTFGGTLTYSQSITGSYPLDVGNSINAAIDVFTLSVSAVEVGSTPQSNFDALFSPQAFPGYADLALDQYLNPGATVINGTATLADTVTLHPGDTIWVWAFLQTPAPNGSAVDASHTLITAWNDTANLIPAIALPPAALPEPASIILVGVSLAGLGLLRRRWSKPSTSRE